MVVAAVVRGGQCAMEIERPAKIAAPNDYCLIQRIRSDPLTIGYYSDIPAHEGHFSGELDELILLNRALSADEIETMYSVGKPL